jgi:hypothetical protein
MNRLRTAPTMVWPRVPRTRGVEPRHVAKVLTREARAGMNQRGSCWSGTGTCVPRTRGDEPETRKV